MATIVILMQWLAYAVLLYVAWYIYQCGIGVQKFDGVYTIKFIALSLFFMVIATICASTLRGGQQYVENTNSKRHSDSAVEQSGLVSPDTGSFRGGIYLQTDCGNPPENP